MAKKVEYFQMEMRADLQVNTDKRRPLRVNPIMQVGAAEELLFCL